MIDESELLKAIDEAEVVRQAALRYTQTDSYQAQLITRYRRLLHFYAPDFGDQWPEDLADRPGKIHMTVNIVKAAINVDARIQAIPPRITLTPDGLAEEERQRAEAAEKLMLTFLELSGWDVWFGDLTRTKCLYGKGVLKPFWNKTSKRPDVVALENPANLRIGWGSSDFRSMDWALYEYLLSPLEAMIQFPELQITPTKGKKPLDVQRWSTHDDPLNQLSPDKDRLRSPMPYQPSEYENKQVSVWDYWYKHPDGTVCNAIIVNGVLARNVTQHAEYPEIPFIVIENDHEPGRPEGMSTAEDIVDLQIEMNRALSHWAQLVADEIDPSWQLVGENNDMVPAGMVPKAGEIVAPGGGNRIDPIVKGVNQFPIETLLRQYWETFHKVTGLSEVLFGQMPGAQTSGRALAVQIEAAANRLDPKRKRLYAGLRELLIFWTYMLEKVNPKFEVAGPDGQPAEAGVGDLVRDFRRWKIIAPEITPRDVIENTTNEVNKVNAKLSSVRTSMDALGIDSPEDEIALIELERSNAHLFPGDVQTYAATLATLQQVQMTMQQMQMQLGQMGGPLASGASQQDAFAAQPQLTQEDNQAGPSQPITGAGGAPPEGATGPLGGIGQTLLRGTPTGQIQNLQQTALRRPV